MADDPGNKYASQTRVDALDLALEFEKACRTRNPARTRRVYAPALWRRWECSGRFANLSSSSSRIDQLFDRNCLWLLLIVVGLFILKSTRQGTVDFELKKREQSGMMAALVTASIADPTDRQELNRLTWEVPL